MAKKCEDDCAGHWVTVRYAEGACDLPRSKIDLLPSILVEAPNGILWTAVLVRPEHYHREVASG